MSKIGIEQINIPSLNEAFPTNEELSVLDGVQKATILQRLGVLSRTELEGLGITDGKVHVVSDITQRDQLLTTLGVGEQVFVINASGDASVASGWAKYIVRPDGMAKKFEKISEKESIDMALATESTHGIMSAEDKAKLNGIEDNANLYVHPTTHSLSMIEETTTRKIMSDVERTKLAGIEANANLYVHPSTHSTDILTESATKKVMTDVERTKLAGIEAAANLYVHPATHSVDILTESATKKVMTSAERTKLTGIADNANLYVHPSTHPIAMIVEDANLKVMTAAERTKLAGMSSGSARVAPSSIDGNILINDVEVVVYAHEQTHDDVYYTKSQVASTNFAGLIGAETIEGINGNTVQTLLANLKLYVDSVKQSLNVKDSVRVATTDNITLSGTQTIDGVVVAVGDRVLVKNQTTASQNGIYDVSAGAWTRSVDADNQPVPGSEVTAGMFTFVAEGSTQADSGWILTTNDDIVLDTTSLTFVQFSGAGQIVAGTGLSKSGNTLSITNTGVVAGTYKSVTVNAQGQVTGGSNPTTLSGYGITDATPSSHVGSGGSAHADATTLASGFMSAASLLKLNGIEANANAYSHPATHPASIIVQDANNRFMTDAERTKLAGIETAAISQTTADARYEKKSDMAQGSSTFASTTGVTITHNLGTTAYRVMITPTAATGGTLGEYWVEKSTNSMVVKNTGSNNTATFDWFVIKD